MTALDLTSLSPEVTLLGTTFVTGPRSALTSTPVTGFSDVASITIVTRVERVDNSNGELLSLTVQGSDDGNSWATVAGPYSFAREGTQSLVVDAPADRLRVTWSAARGVREAVIGSVTARLGVVDAPNAGVQTVTRTVTSAEILGLYASPFEITSGVADTLLVPVAVLANTLNGTGGYLLDGAQHMWISAGDPAGIGVIFWDLPMLAVMLSGGPGYLSDDPIAGFNGQVAAPNQCVGGGLYLSAGEGNPTLGDTDLSVEVLYHAYPVTA